MRRKVVVLLRTFSHLFWVAKTCAHTVSKSVYLVPGVLFVVYMYPGAPCLFSRPFLVLTMTIIQHRPHEVGRADWAGFRHACPHSCCKELRETRSSLKRVVTDDFCCVMDTQETPGMVIFHPRCLP